MSGVRGLILFGCFLMSLVGAVLALVVVSAFLTLDKAILLAAWRHQSAPLRVTSCHLP